MYKMNKLVLLLSLLLSTHALGKNQSFFNLEVAVGYARIAIIEWSKLSGYKIDRKYLELEPTVLSGIDENGTKIVMVLFPLEKGSYEVTYTINKDGYMKRHTTGAWIYSVEQVQKEFNKAPSLPGP